jgi:hypothetical protein
MICACGVGFGLMLAAVLNEKLGSSAILSEALDYSFVGDLFTFVTFFSAWEDVDEAPFLICLELGLFAAFVWQFLKRPRQPSRLDDEDFKASPVAKVGMTLGVVLIVAVAVFLVCHPCVALFVRFSY